MRTPDQRTIMERVAKPPGVSVSDWAEHLMEWAEIEKAKANGHEEPALRAAYWETAYRIVRAACGYLKRELEPGAS